MQARKKEKKINRERTEKKKVFTKHKNEQKTIVR